MYVGFLILVGAYVPSFLASPTEKFGCPQERQLQSKWTAESRCGVDTAYEQLSQLAIFAKETVQNRLVSTSSRARRQNWQGWHACTSKNIKVRKEWGALSAQERIAYTDAVRCLQQKQTRTPASIAPGAKSRYDDWIVTHIEQALTIHYTGTFLSWHRYFTWHYENALITECGYNGTQPYWDWPTTSRYGLANSPIFDGSDTSMSGNGEKIDGQPPVYWGNPKTVPSPRDPGSGGGCVTSGPFKDMTVNLGPANLPIPGNITLAVNNPLAYNPRCLRRSLTQAINDMYDNATSVMYCLSQTTIEEFQDTMQGYIGSTDPGIHGGGHFTLGGDPGRDFKVSPGDPMFYLHHAQIDRVWWMWQMMDPEARMSGDSAIAGTLTLVNDPPSPNVTLDTVIELGYAAGPPLPIRDLLSTTDGPFCYMYE